MSIDQYSTMPVSNDLTNYFKTGMRPSAVKTAGWDIMADLASYIVSLPTAGGTVNALTVTNGRPFGSLPGSGGLLQLLNPAGANTGPATLAPDALAAKSIFAGGMALAGGELQPGVPALLKWDGTQWNLLNPNPAGRNFFVDPCCRVAQGDGTTNLSTSGTYGLVDMVQCYAGGTVSAGKITQDAAGTVASAATKYSCKVQNATLTGSGKVFFRRWLESRDAVALRNQNALFSVLVRHDTGSAIPAFLTVNKFNAQDTPGAVTNIAVGTSVNVNSATDTVVSVAIANMGDCSNGIEVILEIDCGAVTTKNFYATDWQACIRTLAQKCPTLAFESDLLGVMRYFESSYPYGTSPGTASTNGAGFRTGSSIASGTAYGETIKYKVRKPVLPTVVVYSSSSGSNGTVNDATAGTDKSVSQFGKTTEAVEIVNVGGTTTAAGDIIRYLFTADSRL